MKNFTYLLVALSAPILIFAQPLHAETKSLEKDIKLCKSITESEARLRCYDNIFNNISLEQPSEKIQTTEIEPSAPSAKETPATGLGAEFIKPKSPKLIEAKILGDFTGWTGKTIFRLDNGHVWKQINNNVKDYKTRKPIANANVTIKKGLFGSYNLRVENVKRIIQVKRIK